MVVVLVSLGSVFQFDFCVYVSDDTVERLLYK